MSEIAPKKTPLYEEHVRLGAKIVPFAGWLMPVQYTSIMEEHQAVRDNVGMFDISHMGQLVVAAPPLSQKVGGEGAATWLNRMLTNNIDKLDIGMGQYTFLLNERGGIIDDLIVYRTGEDTFLLVVNAARTEEDFAWLQSHLKAGRSPDRPSGGLTSRRVDLQIAPVAYCPPPASLRRAGRPPLLSRSQIEARSSAASRFRGRAWWNYFMHSSAGTRSRRRETRSSIFHSMGPQYPSRAQATPAKMASKFSFEQPMPLNCGMPRSRKAKRLALNRAAWARAIHCAWRCVIP